MTALPEVSGVRWNELSNRKIKPQFEKRSKREQRRASGRGGVRVMNQQQMFVFILFQFVLNAREM